MRPEVIMGAGAALALCVATIIAPWATVMLTIALAVGLTVLGIVILLRAGQISFGHGLYYAAGAYTVAFLVNARLSLDTLVLIPLGGFVAMVIAIAFGFFAVRYRDIFFAMINLAISMVAFSLLEKLYHLTGGGDGMNVARPTLGGVRLGRVAFETWMFYTTLAVAAVSAFLVARYLASPLGKALEAIKSNETRLEYLGVSGNSALHIAYAVSAALAGMSGAIIAIVTGHVAPEFAYWVRSGEFVFISILGGSGNVVGAFAGSIVFEVIRNYAAAFAASYWQTILGLSLIAIIMFAPDGLTQLRLRRKVRP
ncbi:branched-chain amino acid ABC transporter permease [Bosea sp. Tri-44]|uniref:branched-chain amino acid ABC transporter permease n=1 Tax=Bosea sp. Tri-44 TaxID=1972137 RepID=UPI00100E5B4F|nr:branched-chain amino acid ABC transporter permease [Bosea sp. Tri-44]RXT51234.1 branched-chain amino acid ABC transporter permease [Bosea sp. Tri-44]